LRRGPRLNPPRLGRTNRRCTPLREGYGKAKAARHEISDAENREAADAALDRFFENYSAKYPRAAAKLTTDRQPLLAHFAFPAEHWIHLRSTFATVRLRTHKTKDAGSRVAGLAMTY
jgi:putative transposase